MFDIFAQAQYQYIDKGIPVIFQQPFQLTPTNDKSEIHEFSYLVGFQYSNYSFDKHFDLQFSVYSINVKNYHNIEGNDQSFPTHSKYLQMQVRSLSYSVFTTAYESGRATRPKSL